MTSPPLPPLGDVHHVGLFAPWSSTVVIILSAALFVMAWSRQYLKLSDTMAFTFRLAVIAITTVGTVLWVDQFWSVL